MTPLATPLSPASLLGLVENAPDAIFVADAAGRYTYANAAASRLLGYRREEILGLSVAELVGPEDIARLEESRVQMMAGQSHVGEWRLRRSDGTWAHVEVHANILPDGQWQAFVRDIAERKGHEVEREALFQAIDRERKWLRAVIDGLPLPVMLYETDGHLLSFNAPADALLGPLSASGGFTQYACRVFRPDGRPVPPEELPSARALALGESRVGEEFVIQPSGGRPRARVLATTCAISDEQGRVSGSVCMLQDITERTRSTRCCRPSSSSCRSGSGSPTPAAASPQTTRPRSASGPAPATCLSASSPSTRAGGWIRGSPSRPTNGRSRRR